MSLTLVYLKCLLLTFIIVNYNTSVENTLVIIINSSFTVHSDLRKGMERSIFFCLSTKV